MTVASVCSVALGAVFLLSAGAKIASRDRWPAQAEQLGAPRRLVPFVPWIELVIAALLIVRLGVPWVPLAALAMLVAFSTVLIATLRAGVHPMCACFGNWSTKPLSWVDVARNVVLMCVALGAAL